MYAIVSIFLDDNCYLKLARFLTAVDISCQVSATEGAGRPSQYRYCIFLRWFCVKQGQISALHHQECFLGMASQLSCGCLEAGSQRTRGIRSEPIIHIHIYINIYIYALLQQSMREQGAAVRSQLRFPSTWGCGCAVSSWLNPHEPNLGTSVVLKILGPEYRPGWLPLIVHIPLGRIFPSANYQSCRLRWTGTVWTRAGDHSWGQCGHGHLAQGWKQICH